MSLIAQLPLAAIRFPCKDVEGSKRFYRDVIGLKILEDEAQADGEKNGQDLKNVHFDLGNIMLTLTPSNSTKVEPAATTSSTAKLVSNGQLVFVVENAIDVVYADLAKRGIKFKSKKINEDSTGKMVSFPDPDGNMIYLWQPPQRNSKNFKGVEGVVRHYELVSRALADLREADVE